MILNGVFYTAKHFLSNLTELRASSDHNLKQRFQTLIFPEKIYNENKMFRTTATVLIAKYLHSKNRLESYMVPPTEPSLNQVMGELENIFKFKDLLQAA